MTKLFISHSTQDDAFVRNLCAVLSEHGPLNQERRLIPRWLDHAPANRLELAGMDLNESR